MYTSNPDFEAMKDLTRLYWLLDLDPHMGPSQPNASATNAPRQDRA